MTTTKNAPGSNRLVTGTCWDCKTVFEYDPYEVTTVGLVDGTTGYSETDVPNQWVPLCDTCADEDA